VSSCGITEITGSSHAKISPPGGLTPLFAFVKRVPFGFGEKPNPFWMSEKQNTFKGLTFQ
jgi:hypothetical protein